MTAVATKTNGHAATQIAPVTNDAESIILSAAPYVARVTIEGVAPLLFHRWSCEDVEAKANAAKGSKAKKTDNVESYVYRCADGTIGIPGTYLVGSITNKSNGAAKYLQDPRSPRKSALDLYKAGVIPLTICASLGRDTWDYLDQQRVVIQQSAVTRIRPAFLPGWQATFDLQVNLPEYIRKSDLLQILTNAGRLVGVGDFRPTYGRFQVISFEVLTD